MADKRSLLGLENALLDADRIPADGLENALEHETDVYSGVEDSGAPNVVPTITAFDFGSDYMFRYDRKTPENSLYSQIWFGAVVSGTVEFRIFLRNGGSYVTPTFRLAPVCFSEGVGFCPLKLQKAGTPAFTTEHIGSNSVNHPNTGDNLRPYGVTATGIGIMPLAIQADAQIYAMWMGVPFRLPRQWQRDGSPLASRNYTTHTAVAESGHIGQIVQRAKPGSLKPRMPDVSHDWIQENWYSATYYMARYPFWYSLYDQPANDRERAEIAYCWNDKTPPPVNIMSTGFAEIRLDAKTHPDYST